MDKITITKEKLMETMSNATREVVSDIFEQDDSELSTSLIIFSGIIYAKTAYKLFDEEN